MKSYGVYPGPARSAAAFKKSEIETMMERSGLTDTVWGSGKSYWVALNRKKIQ